MADLSCSFLDFRSLTTNCRLPLFLPPKRYCSSALDSHNSRISRIKRRPLHLTLLCLPSSRAPSSSSSELDVISTHEHSDGSLLFRFGDPSEVAKNVKMEESKNVKEEIEGENNDVSSTLKVAEGDDESEVMAKKADREVTGSSLTEVADHTNSIVSSSEGVTVVEGESESCEKLLEGSSDTELPILTANEEMEGISTQDVDIEHIEKVEEGLNEEYEDSSAVESSILDESSKVDSDIATVELSEKDAALSEKETADNVEEGLDEEQKESSTANASIRDQSPEVENNTTTLEIMEKETAEVTSMAEPTIAVPDNGVLQASLETVVTTDVSPISEHQNVETEMKNETTEDGSESFDCNLVSPSPQSEPAISLSKEIEEHNLQGEMQKVAIGKSSESDMNDIEALEMQNVIGNGHAMDTSDAEAKSPPMEAAMNETSGAGSGMPNETVGYVSEKDTIQLMTMPPRLEADSMLEEETGIETVEESREHDRSEHLKVGGDLVEASVHEAAVIESTPMSQEMLMTNFVLSSGTALLSHPSKVLTGGEDAYFIAGQTWLGVADGVGQWSLEGTNPGVYAQELVKNCERLVSVDNGDSINNPMELLNLSIAETHSPGSSTVLIAQFDGQALHVANVGDSGFIVLRDGAVYKRSSPMHHVFYFPLQIERGDDPSSLAEFYRVDLEEDDVIITATDGLLDNLYDQEISLIVMKSLASDKKLEEIAELLAVKAQEIGSSASVRTPFADDAQAAGFVGYRGGKLDDVAVIVSVVKRR